MPLEIDPASIKTKLSKEEQQKLLDERLTKMRLDKAKNDKELEKQQELSRIQMNKELNEVLMNSSPSLQLPHVSRATPPHSFSRACAFSCKHACLWHVCACNEGKVLMCART